MASLHEKFLDAGVRLYGIVVDSPGQNSAMIDKLDLPFPILSDPDRSGAITPLDLRNEKDPRGLALPALVLIGTDGEEVWRYVSRDYADRMPEDEVLGVIESQGWSATTQPAPALGPIEPGDNAMPLEKLPTYLKGAKFAAQAMGLRHAHFDDAIKEDSKAFVAEMDSYIEQTTALLKRRADRR